MTTKKLLLQTLALTLLVSAFLLFATGNLSQKNAYGSEICLQKPWNVDVKVKCDGDVVRYNLDENLTGNEAENVFFGRDAKLRLLSEVKQMQLPFEAVCDYFLPNFYKKVVAHFAYVECDRVDASVSFDGTFSYAKGQDGKKIDCDKLLVDVLAAAGKNATVNLPLIVDKAVTVDFLRRNTVLKGRFVTSFATSGANRSFNIEKCVKRLNGTVVGVGEKFSFNDIVGPRTKECGYKNAVVISDGKYVDGFGGGVCQVSTTLYNALLLGGFVPRAHRHTLVSGYVKPGFDAMVSYGTTDLSFVNDTDMPVYIGATTKNRQIVFCVYGVSNEYRIERESEFERVPFETRYVSDETLGGGEQKVLVRGSDGVKSKSYLCYYDGETLVKRVLLRKDEYKKVDKVIAVPLQTDLDA